MHIKVCGKVHKPRHLLTSVTACRDQQKKYRTMEYTVYFYFEERIFKKTKIAYHPGTAVSRNKKVFICPELYTMLLSIYFLINDLVRECVLLAESPEPDQISSVENFFIRPAMAVTSVFHPVQHKTQNHTTRDFLFSSRVLLKKLH